MRLDLPKKREFYTMQNVFPFDQQISSNYLQELIYIYYLGRFFIFVGFEFHSSVCLRRIIQPHFFLSQKIKFFFHVFLFLSKSKELTIFS
jgi:hypothetical protein